MKKFATLLCLLALTAFHATASVSEPPQLLWENVLPVLGSFNPSIQSPDVYKGKFIRVADNRRYVIHKVSFTMRIEQLRESRMPRKDRLERRRSDFYFKPATISVQDFFQRFIHTNQALPARLYQEKIDGVEKTFWMYQALVKSLPPEFPIVYGITYIFALELDPVQSL